MCQGVTSQISSQLWCHCFLMVLARWLFWVFPTNLTPKLSTTIEKTMGYHACHQSSGVYWYSQYLDLSGRSFSCFVYKPSIWQPIHAAGDYGIYLAIGYFVMYVIVLNVFIWNYFIGILMHSGWTMVIPIGKLAGRLANGVIMLEG